MATATAAARKTASVAVRRDSRVVIDLGGLAIREA